MSRTKSQAVAIRKEYVDRVGMQFVEVSEYDLVVASLRVPEVA